MTDTLLAPLTQAEQTSSIDSLTDKTKKTIEERKAESDNYIKVLEGRLDEMRSDYLKLRADSEAQAKLTDLIDKLEKERQQSTIHTQPLVIDDKRPVVDLNQIESLVEKKLQAREGAQKQQDNLNLVRNKLKEVHGDKYPDFVKQHIDTLGITESRLNEMARNEPTVLIRALGLDKPVQTENFQAPARSSQRSDNFAPTTNQKRTWSYYQKLKADNPKAYYDPKTNINMHNDMMALGAEFQDGDFSRFD